MSRRVAEGATGKPLTTDITRDHSFDDHKNILTYRSPAGMPNWGTSDQLSKEQINMMARYLMLQPLAPPEWDMPDMLGSWEVEVSPEDANRKTH